MSFQYSFLCSRELYFIFKRDTSKSSTVYYVKISNSIKAVILWVFDKEGDNVNI